jgi:catechol 2,3-dioxygenase-like lactoylglutathione lyase family enzyme
MSDFKMGTLDHMHLLVPDRYEAAFWYQQNLGFEIVKQYEVWAQVEGGPLHISADGGRSGLALFERGQHPEFRVETSVAFRVRAGEFVAFADNLSSANLRGMNGQPLKRESVVDHDLCYAYYFQDPYGNRFELDCYDYDEVRRDLVEQHSIIPVRFW